MAKAKGKKIVTLKLTNKEISLLERFMTNWMWREAEEELQRIGSGHLNNYPEKDMKRMAKNYRSNLKLRDSVYGKVTAAEMEANPAPWDSDAW